jgi:hypothetical protein
VEFIFREFQADQCLGHDVENEQPSMGTHTFSFTIGNVLVDFSGSWQSKQKQEDQTIGVDRVLWGNP